MRLVIAIAILCAGCERADPDLCPAGTRTVEMAGPRAERHCELPDGRLHGPVFAGDYQADQRLGQYEYGKPAGQWSFDLSGMHTEKHYRDGELDGVVSYSIHGVENYHCEYQAGKRHGLCVRSLGGREEMRFAEGRRSGAWVDRDRSGRVVRVRLYGDDVLLAQDGKPVLPPPESVVTKRHTIRRSECTQVDINVRAACLEVFDAYQACADSACRDEAVDRYLDRLGSPRP